MFVPVCARRGGAMTLFHFINCAALTFGPHAVYYKATPLYVVLCHFGFVCSCGFSFPFAICFCCVSLEGCLVCSTMSAPSNALVHLLLAIFEFLRFHSPQPPSLIRFFNPTLENLICCCVSSFSTFGCFCFSSPL